MNCRARAATILYDVINKGRSLSDALEQNDLSDARDHALVQSICYGVCRFYFRLNFILQVLLPKPLKEKDQDIYCLLLVGLYQLAEMRIPPHAAVKETVAAVAFFKKTWAKNLVNAILRHYQRRASEIHDKILQNEVAKFSHPQWMIDKVKHTWEEAPAILEANNLHPPFSLRVNLNKISRMAYAAQCQDSQEIAETESGIVLKQPLDITKLPGFLEGKVSVQDGAAQLAASLLELSPNLRVLDAAAAPGGKAAHILEKETTTKLVALEKDEKRRLSILENLKRLNLTAECIHVDAADVKSWWDGQLFDRILLDVPCSASGVIRRHPDIKLLRRESDINALNKEQLRLLNNIWPTLKKDGLLVYATCSIFVEENSDILQKFLKDHPDACEEKIKSSWGKECIIGRQILPGMHGMDGFYYARIRKC